MPERIAVAMSGGVDSSVAAHLCLDAGYEVVGLYMCSELRTQSDVPTRLNTCCSARDLADARRVAHHLGIPFHVIKLGEEFRRILDYFCDEYLAGRTPNPCVPCNRLIKFGRLMQEARKQGCTRLATGHYAGVDSVAGRHRLLRGHDRDKDQSYFLFELSQEQLAWTVFPLHDLTKKEVRRIAADLELHVRDKSESQEVCLVPDNDYAGLLREHRPGLTRPGEMVDTAGTVVGSHQGVAFYTIGQRRGLGAHGGPRYVVGLDATKNRVIIGSNEDLLRADLVVERVNWVSLAGLDGPLTANVQIRYRHPGALARLVARPDGSVGVHFEKAQRAITPGQAAVFYEGEVVLGGGWIV